MTTAVGYNNLIDSATISTGGTWSGTYPVSNVQNRFLGVFARTTGGGPSIYMDLGAAQTIGIIGIAGISLAANTSIGVRYSTDNWGSSTWVTSPTYIAQSDYGIGSSFFVVVPDISARYWSIAFSFASGQCDIGRVFIGPKFMPQYGLSFGASMGLEVRTNRAETDGGARFHRTRTLRRVFNGSYDYLSDAEGHAFRAVQAALDISGEAVLIWDHADTSDKRTDRNMLCNLDELDAMEFPYAAHRKIGLKASEIIA